ncbi:hypothetical protein Tco_1511764 [Tanacetum coccineum]
MTANSAANVLAEWIAVYDAHKEELKSMFEKQAGVERFDLIQTFHACKLEDGKLVGGYVLKIKDYMEQLERLGYVLPQDLSVGLILNGLTSDFAGFYENVLPKKAATPQVMTVQGGGNQKANKKSQKAKGKGKGKAREKIKVISLSPKTLNLLLKSTRQRMTPATTVKRWVIRKMNCPVYLAELMKNKMKVGTASSSGIFTIELFTFPNKSWVYDTGCGTHICFTKQGFSGARKLEQGALYLYVGNGVCAQVEAIGSFDLVLPNGLVIHLDNCHYAPTISAGVVLVSRLIDSGFI